MTDIDELPAPETPRLIVNEHTGEVIGYATGYRSAVFFADLYDEIDRLSADVNRLQADRRALDIAVTGLRRIELAWFDDGNAAADTGNHEIATVIREARATVSQLLQKIGGTR